MVADGVRNSTRNNSIARSLAENGHGDSPADFEKAISATKFGMYNVVLLLAAMPAGWASAIDMTTAAFYAASAECDLQLTFIRTGALVSFVYIGMIVSSFFWGFVTENARRKPLIIIGLLVDASCNILSSVVDSYHIFLLIKFINGTIISGPLSLLVPYLAEFQSVAHRANFVSWTGFIFAFGNVIPAFLAFAILPLPWSFTVFDRCFVAWRLYILACSIPSILGVLTMSFLPESPKRLMATGQSAKALQLMKRMYRINTLKPADTFPIRVLLVESQNFSNAKRQTNYDRIRENWDNFKILLGQPKFFITTFLQFGSMLGFNTMRLWVPHIFTIMNNFDYTLWDSPWVKPTLCELLVPGEVSPALDDPVLYANITDTCIRWRIESFIYMNSTIIATSAVSLSFFIVMFLDTRITKKVVLLGSFLIGTLCTFGTNWGQVVPIMLTMCSAVIAASRIASNIIVIVASENMTPAPLKATAASFITMVGSLGTVVGNLIFSSLLSVECVAAFMWLGCSLLLCAIVSLFALRSAPKKSPDSEKAEDPKAVHRF